MPQKKYLTIHSYIEHGSAVKTVDQLTLRAQEIKVNASFGWRLISTIAVDADEAKVIQDVFEIDAE